MKYAITHKIAAGRDWRLILQREDGAVGIARVNAAAMRALEAGGGEVTAELMMTPAEIANLAIMHLGGPQGPEERRLTTAPGATALLAAALIVGAARLEQQQEARRPEGPNGKQEATRPEGPSGKQEATRPEGPSGTQQ